MPTIKERIKEMNGKPFYSFEYFPPKTPAGEGSGCKKNCAAAFCS
jgi:5,10-methylenetetrahydrofolate reductase